MQTVAELPRPHGEGPPVPSMWQADLDPAALDQLFADLAAEAEVLSILGKGGPRNYASSEPLTLAAAYDRLTSGEITGVQLRYRFDGSEWADTLLWTGSKYRLIRCRVPRT